MVQKSTSTSKPRGRPPAFDRNAVVETAVFAFWSNGFEATTLDDLEQATGVDRSTLYNSFGGKRGLYEAAAEAYVALADDQLFSPLQEGEAGIDDIVEFMDRLVASYRGGAPKGCLIVNDMASVPDLAARTTYLDHLSAGFTSALARSAAMGETDGAKADQRSQMLTAAVVGVNVAHKNAMDSDAAYALIDGARAEVLSWKMGA